MISMFDFFFYFQEDFKIIVNEITLKYEFDI